MNPMLSLLLNIVLFVIAFGLLVFLHELGHYLMSKLFGVQVEEFGFGFPPRLVKLFQFRETEFTLNWIPFGAFVRPKGENDPTVPGGLAAANPWARLVVLLGGSAMNLITGIVLFILAFNIYGEPDPSRVKIDSVVAGSAAEAAGIQHNDIIQKVNGTPIDSYQKLKGIVDQNLEKQITLTVERNGQVIELKATPHTPTADKPGALGIVMGMPFKEIPSSQVLPQAVKMTADQGRALISLPFMLIRGQVSPEQGRMVGPKGIYDIFTVARQIDQQDSQASQSAVPIGYYTLTFLATISVALGYTNLLPIPALDGGRILFVLPEILLRRRVPAQYENMIHLIGFTALILLMIYITTQDIINPVMSR